MVNVICGTIILVTTIVCYTMIEVVRRMKK